MDDEHPYTYASTQATHCAGCGEYKHTPLRIDAMGGYVCLTCIDRKLGALLGEFGYPAPQQPLTDAEIKAAITGGVRSGQVSWVGYEKDAEGYYTLPSLSKQHYQIARAIERALGIGA